MRHPYRQIGYGILLAGGLLTAVYSGSNSRAQTVDRSLANFNYLSSVAAGGKGYDTINFIDTKTGKIVTGFGRADLMILETDLEGIGHIAYFNKFSSHELGEVIIGKDNGTIERIKLGDNEWRNYVAEYERLKQVGVEAHTTLTEIVNQR